MDGTVRQRTEHPPEKAWIGSRGNRPMCVGLPRFPNPCHQWTSIANRIVWLVGAVVIIVVVLGFFGLR